MFVRRRQNLPITFPQLETTAHGAARGRAPRSPTPGGPQADGWPDASEAELAFEHAELSRGVARDVGRLGFGRPLHQR